MALLALLAAPVAAQVAADAVVSQTVALDPAVLAAQHAEVEAPTVYGSLSATLDEAAAAFEAAQTQTLVLDGELAQARGRPSRAPRSAVEDARTALARRSGGPTCTRAPRSWRCRRPCSPPTTPPAPCTRARSTATS